MTKVLTCTHCGGYPMNLRSGGCYACENTGFLPEDCIGECPNCWGLGMLSKDQVCMACNGTGLVECDPDRNAAIAFGSAK